MNLFYTMRAICHGVVMMMTASMTTNAATSMGRRTVHKCVKHKNDNSTAPCLMNRGANTPLFNGHIVGDAIVLILVASFGAVVLDYVFAR